MKCLIKCILNTNRDSVRMMCWRESVCPKEVFIYILHPELYLERDRVRSGMCIVSIEIIYNQHINSMRSCGTYTATQSLPNSLPREMNQYDFRLTGS